MTYLCYQILITVFIAFPPFIFQANGIYLGLRDGTAMTLGCTLVAELMALGLLALWLRRRRLSFAGLGLGRPTTHASLCVATVFGAFYAAFTLHALGLTEHLREVSFFRLWGMFVGVVGAFAEEVIFRGFLLTELERIRVSPVWQILISALLFSLVHLSFNIGGIVATFVMGAALAVVYITGGRSLTAPIIGHALINLIIEPWLLLWLITFYSQHHR